MKNFKFLTACLAILAVLFSLLNAKLLSELREHVQQQTAEEVEEEEFYDEDSELPTADEAGEEEQPRDDEEMWEFKTPDMTEEEQHSQHMPLHMHCDGCKLIAILLDKKFQKATGRRGDSYVMPESDVIDIVEKLCEDKYEDYGAKEVNGVLRLTGPMTDAEHIPGVTSGGGKWPNRIRQLCSRYWDELGDEVLYAAWRDAPGSFEHYLCFSPRRPRNACYKTLLAEDNGDEREALIQSLEIDDRDRQQRIEEIGKENLKKRKAAVHSEL